jgi:hypothetical protein
MQLRATYKCLAGKVCGFSSDEIRKMGVYPLIAMLLFLLVLPASAQLSSEFSALNNIVRGKWEKARKQLNKAIHKDSTNAGAYYGFAVYFFSTESPDFQIDTAYRYTLKAQAWFNRASIKQRERWRKLPMDSLSLWQYRQRIDSAAFARALTLNTEAAYVDFLHRFSLAQQSARATELRNEAAYLDALKENTYSAFERYMVKYPESERVAEAKARYEKLLFEVKTKDKKLASYETFLAQHPTTPYRRVAELEIFQIITAAGENQGFELFLKKYPESHHASFARNLLYYRIREVEGNMPTNLVNDSIRNLQSLQRQYLVPFLKDKQFGFMNHRGEVIIKPSAKEIDDDYLCGNITEELLVLENSIVARNGSVIYQGKIKSVDELGYGFLKISTAGGIEVIHYSGRSIGHATDFQDAEVLGKNFLKLKKNSKWSVWSFAGRMLLPFEFDELFQIGQVVVAGKDSKFKMARVADIARAADQVEVPWLGNFDEVKPWPHEMIYTLSGNQPKVFTQHLNEWISASPQALTSTFFGAMSKTSTGNKLYSPHVPPREFNRVKINQPWVAAQQANQWHLLHPSTLQGMGPAFDSIGFIGPFAVAVRKDSLRVYVTQHVFVNAPTSVKPQFLPGKDSLFFLLLEYGDKKILYNTKGEQLFAMNYDRIEYNQEGFFTVTRKEKRGLISFDGKPVILPEYDAIGSVTGGIVAVLKDKKFGCLDITNRKQIKPEYEKNINRYNAKTLIAFKNGYYGLIDWNNKPLSAFEFEEVIYWSDSVALVKKNFNWMVYNFYNKKVILDKIKKFKWVSDTEAEKILIVQQENNYGVISNKRGVVIPPTFSDIVNLGSAATPLYFTEKHVEEASIFVVIYYDKNGVQLLRQVFESDDYDRIYCAKGQQ